MERRRTPMRDLALLLIIMETVLIIKATSLPPTC
jgi:hypothetical protein